MSALPDSVIRVEVNNGAFVETYDISDVPTIGAMWAKFRDDNGFRFAQDPVVFDPSNNRVCGNSEAIKGGNVYVMTCWIIQKVDDAGNPVKKEVLM